MLWASSAMDPRPGTSPIQLQERDVFLRRYEIEAGTRRGRSAVVYRARDLETNESVALKIHDEPATPVETGRFLADAKKVAAQYHPHLIRYVNSGAHAGHLFAVMDWIDGETLHERLQRQPLTMREAVSVALRIASALERLHRIGLVHGRLRPENVFLRRRELDWVKLSDIAVPRSGLPRAPGPEVSVEEAGFLAPEASKGGETRPTADVYALGAILFLCLTGTMPFEAADVFELATMRWAPAPELESFRPDAPRGLAGAVARMLARQATSRLPDGAAAVAQLSPHTDLGWGADRQPPAIVRLPGGERSMIPLVRRPFEPLDDAEFHRVLTGLLVAACPDPKGHGRLHDIAHDRAGPGRNVVPCALCGHGAPAGGSFVEIRPEGLCPLEEDEAGSARPPSICTSCIHLPFEAVDTAVRSTFAGLQGDDGTPIAPLGPSRKEARDALVMLASRAVPRFDRDVPCLICGRTGRTLRGARANVCAPCLIDARAVYSGWRASAPARHAASVRAEYIEIFLLAEERVKGGSPGFRPTPEHEIELPVHVSNVCGVNVYIDLVSLTNAKERRGGGVEQAAVDRLAGEIADALMAHVYWGLDGHPDFRRKRSAPGHSGLAGVVERFTSTFHPASARGERIRIGAVMLGEALERGVRFYGKNDDGFYEDDTRYYDPFRAMARRGGP